MPKTPSPTGGPQIRATDWRRVIAELERIVGADNVIDDAESMRPYECDGLSMYRAMPRVVVLPNMVEEAQAVVRYANECSLPVVARGAGTGLSAGATPDPGGILLSMARFDRILEIDSHSRLARVEPGVTNLSISDAAAPHGLFYAPDPSSQIACSIGGNVAENSGGVHCLKYGLTVHNLLEVNLITADGEMLSVGSRGLDAAGPDLLALVTGSEGLLGVVTEVTVRLLPIPETARVLLAAFDNVRRAGEAVSAIIASGIVPAGLEMMDNTAIRAAEDYAEAGYPTDAVALLLCELDGTESEVESLVGRVTGLLEGAGAGEVRVSRNEAERQAFWRGRKSAFPAVGRISPDYYCMDGTIPRSRIADVLDDIHALSMRHGLEVANVFHAGDGNLHPLILFDANVPGEFETAEAFGADILELCVEAGGAITGEHGVGLEKIRQVPLQFNDEELTQLGLVKLALDPKQTLNPGKAVPILRRCQEYRALDKSAGSATARAR